MYRVSTRFPIQGVVSAVAASLLLMSPAGAAEWRSQRDALAEGQRSVEQAFRGRLDDAFVQAENLARPGDEAARARLRAEKGFAVDSAARLGVARRLSVPEEMFFAGCITRSYLVRYAGGQQRWQLKFRRGAKGWYLSDLDVRAS